MAPNDDGTFYLYGIGYDPKQFTLGTVVWENYARPETRYATLPNIEHAHTHPEFESINDLETQGIVSSLDLGTCILSPATQREFGFGVKFFDVAKVDVAIGTNRQKVLQIEGGRRVVINHPGNFFEDHVLGCDKIRKALGDWLTVGHSSYIQKMLKNAFRKPRIYCITGLYQLKGVRALTNSGNTASASLGISSGAAAAATTGVPLGGTDAHASRVTAVETDMVVRGSNIWAARFHQLDVKYMYSLTGTETANLTRTIKLFPDALIPGEAVRADDQEEYTAELQIQEPYECSEEGDTAYWNVFNTAWERYKDGDD